MMAFLHRVENGGGTLHREFAIGSGRLDMLLEYKGTRLPMELKVWRPGQRDPEKEGLEQIDEYIYRPEEGRAVNWSKEGQA
jgi:glycine betaine/choline ABC-type transport system substrate-binding protein